LGVIEARKSVLNPSSIYY